MADLIPYKVIMGRVKDDIDFIAEQAYERGKREVFEQLSLTPPEKLTDKEQRIFLAAMEREEKVCEEVDRDYTREPYEDSLVRVCREITRKVKGALWT